MKRCIKCLAEKEESAFRPPKNTCRKCESIARMDRIKNSPRSHMAAIEAYRRYRATGKANKGGGANDYERYRDKKLIRAETKRLVQKGMIPTRDACERCGSPDVEIHHLSYERADHITWLCRACHMKEHRLSYAEVAAKHDSAIRQDNPNET